MSSDLNTVALVGRLTRDPEMFTTANGKYVTKFSIANNQYRRNQETNQWESIPSYYNIVVWGNIAMQCKNQLAKGRQVAVHGRLQQRQWVDKQTQQNRRVIEIVANTVQFLGGRSDAPSQGYSPAASASPSPAVPTDNSQYNGPASSDPTPQTPQPGNNNDQSAVDYSDPLEDFDETDMPF